MVAFKYKNGSTWTNLVMPVANGGTALTAAPSVLVNLASTTAVNLLQSAPRPGVTGVLPVGNGGTGTNSLSNLANSLKTYLPVVNGAKGSFKYTGKNNAVPTMTLDSGSGITITNNYLKVDKSGPYLITSPQMDVVNSVVYRYSNSSGGSETKMGEFSTYLGNGGYNKFGAAVSGFYGGTTPLDANYWYTFKANAGNSSAARQCYIIYIGT